MHGALTSPIAMRKVAQALPHILIGGSFGAGDLGGFVRRNWGLGFGIEEDLCSDLTSSVEKFEGF